MIDNDYHKRLNCVLMSKYYQDTSNNLNNVVNPNMTGGSMRRQFDYMPPTFVLNREAEGKKPILSGTSPYTMDVQKRMMDQYMKNMGLDKINYNYSRNINKNMRGGDIWGDIGNFFKPVASAVLDIGAPIAGTFIGGPAGATLAKGAREGLRAVTGVGLKKKGKKSKMSGIGSYSAGVLKATDTAVGGAMSGGCDGNMSCVPCKMKGRGKKSAGAKSAGKKGSRMELVKKIMKEKGMKLGEASKYIKANNLY